MTPRVLRDGWVVVHSFAGGRVLAHPDHGELTLLGLADALLDLADGTRDLDHLAALTGSVPEDIFAALDELADAGLLTERVAPPAAPRPRSRREVLRTLALAGAAGLAAGLPDRALAGPKGQIVPAPLPLTADEARALAARPPHEQVYKEATMKADHGRLLSASEADEKVRAPLAAEESYKAAAAIVTAYDVAARADDSADEQRVKKDVGLDPELAARAESQRKADVAPLRAEEQDYKARAKTAEQELKAHPLADAAAALSLREQRAKLAGDLGEPAEQAHKALVAAREQRHKKGKLAAEQEEKQLARAQERRNKADVAGGRDREQVQKNQLRAREQLIKDRSAERQQKLAAADEQREKLDARQVERFHEVRAKRQTMADEQAQKAQSDKSLGSAIKATAAEQRVKDDFLVELPGPAQE